MGKILVWVGADHACHGPSTIQCCKHAGGYVRQDGVGMGSKRATGKGCPRSQDALRGSPEVSQPERE